MPRPTLPPTPASSTDIKGKDGAHALAQQLQLSFELPPPALAQDSSNSQLSPSDAHVSPKSYPMQAAEAVKARRRASSTAQKPAGESFALPPPPTRSRKIIQMKPRGAQQDDAPGSSSTAGPSSATKAASAAAGKASAAATITPSKESAKKKQPSATSAAGRKIARKTAHSLIERRRRSKMNEEFAVLKGMIPACTGEMHKLAILQASIEYVRYLEDCVSKLKEQRDVALESAPPDSGLQTPSGGRDPWGSIPQFHPSYQPDDDVEMAGSDAPSPTFTAQPSRSQQPSVSPALLPQDARNRHDSYSSTSTDHRHYSYSSATTSPAFGPQAYNYGRGGPSLPPSTLTSPALPPLREHRDLDQEATAALLMLNSDRRGSLMVRPPTRDGDHGNHTAVTGAPQPSQAPNGAGRGMSSSRSPNSTLATPRDLDENYENTDLSEKTFQVQNPTDGPSQPRGVPRDFPAARSVPRTVPTSSALRSAVFNSPPGVEPPPYYPLVGKPATKPSVRLPTRANPPRRQPPPKKPPVLYETSSRRLVQSLTLLTFRHLDSPPPSPPPAYDDSSSDAYSVSSYYQIPNRKTSSTRLRRTSTMASNPTMPKVATSPPPPPPFAPAALQTGPRPAPRPAAAGGGPGSKQDILADLRRQLDDSASDAASSVDSRGRRRPRNRSRNNKALAKNAGGLQQPSVMPRLAETKPVRLQLGLNLDVELELKARLQGDVSLTLLVESRNPSPRTSAELKLPGAVGAPVDVDEMFHMRLGVLRLRRTWVDILGRDICEPARRATVTAVLVGVLSFGAALGFVAGQWLV